MASFLSLVQKLQQRTGTGGIDMAQVTGQLGDQRRLVTFIQEAWDEIQSSANDWSFRWAEFSKNLVAGAQTYDIAAAIAGGEIRIGTGPFLLTKTSDTTQRRRLVLLDKNLFDDRHMTSTLTPGFPQEACFLPDDQVRFDRVTDVDYTLSGPYYTANQSLTANADVPDMPAKYHDAIFYLALKKWAEFEETREVYNTASATHQDWMNLMIREMTPDILIGANALGTPSSSGYAWWVR